MSAEIKARAVFEQKYIPEPNSGCWLWEGYVTASGYGEISVGRKSVRAHRFFFMCHSRQVLLPRNIVCHRCDNPCCVNPDHLFVGSTQDNINDKVRKGRAKGQRPGAGHTNAKLTELTAMVALHRVLGRGETQRVVAADLGVSQSTISELCAGNSWKHIRAQWQREAA